MMANRVVLKAPIWDGHKEPKFGIAEFKMMQPVIEVECLYTAKGVRSFPHIYRITRERALTFPRQVVKYGVILRVIPVEAFEEVPR